MPPANIRAESVAVVWIEESEWPTTQPMAPHMTPDASQESRTVAYDVG